MKWLQNNLPGTILAALCGFLLLLAALLAFVGTRPASSGDASAAELDLALEQPAKPLELEPLGKYRVVTDRPLFNQSRRPVIKIEDSEQPDAELAQAEVGEAPKVKLTGVVMTPDMRLVSLTPEGGGEPLVLGEGKPMRGEYNGWVVRTVSPRSATLESGDGRQVELALVVHDQLIKEPPKPPPPAPERDAADEDPEDGSPERLTRAEEIRQRIAERREQLRQQAEAEELASEEGAEGDKASPYAQAIRNMISQGNKKRDDDEE